MPAVRRAPKDTLIVADGFSCRTQIAQATDRRALHLADLIELAIQEGVDGPAGGYPESRYVPEYGRARRLRPAPALAGALIGAAVGMGCSLAYRR